ncbi:limonene-1,2-epoxide hydrolase family protein [Rhodococcus sp. NPDC003382]|uniref:limonene-1,2-epoxide hydrolase family protein n=1 Tax=Rhodococcus sp. HM1 TaxID=2937759 RepID=UPI00200A588E|nr:limonene-1,2-epoxide hydrolase family protein [Rhodococcus sp. HM1]MCK8671121.1 nuclear transport factor 2 family protein [Rhodococcus sp. HM1]
MTTSDTTTSQSAIAVVRNFLDALAASDIATAVALLDPEIAWYNTGLPTLRGLPRVSRTLQGMSRPSVGLNVVMHHIADDGNGVVLTERTDVLRVGRVSIAFWVCGTFEVRDGRIRVWRDHYDMATFLGATATGVLRAVLRRS